jgi:Ca-activated chloride channel family protein
MAIDLWMDNGTARVLIRQIYASHVSEVLEGNYVFALPSRATVSDFAVWDGVTRLPGVILERKRAEEIYNNLRLQAIDPGLLQVGEAEGAEARRASVFSAKVVPIPGWGTKRVEIEYHETIPVEDLKSFFALPLRPDAYRAMTAGRFWITMELRSAHPMRDFEFVSKLYPMRVAERTPNLVKASFEGRDVTFTEDFAIRWAYDSSAPRRLEVIAHRELSGEPGFFKASALLANGARQAPAALPPRAVVALFDTSLSMQWEKLERNYQALEALLRSLTPADRFCLILFNTEVTAMQPAPQAATPAAIEKALAFVKSSRLRGGTDLERALSAGLEHASRMDGVSDPYLVLLSDGGATRGTVANGKLAAAYERRWKQMADARRPRTFVWAVGDDANLPLLRMLARGEPGKSGVLEEVRSTEPADFKLAAFLGKIGHRPLDDIRFTAEPSTNFDLVYPLEESSYWGSAAAWVGQYKAPAQATFALTARHGGAAFEQRAAVALPQESNEHPSLPRTWAVARVKALLEKIERDGEDRATVDEIIRLARKYKFVTPYTSFLAAPRALLRPRLIKPGDPVLRVRTDPSVVAVTALFPFGLVKPLRYLPGEDIWQTRFLAPVDLPDGTHTVRLILRDRNGRVAREAKTFVILSKPPVVQVALTKTRYRAGETVPLRVQASATTRTITARVWGSPPAALRWDAAAKANTGALVLSPSLPPGAYTVTVMAEDMAHNVGSKEVVIHVVP